MDFDLLTAILIILDLGAAVYLFMLILELWRKRIFALGHWYSKDNESGLYWQVVIGYILLINTIFFLRFFVLP
jgi:hypothetical protein